MEPKKKGMTLVAKQKAAGWLFLVPASAMIAIMSFFPMVKAFIVSLQTGRGLNMHFTGFSNYVRMFQDKVFLRSVGNTFFYLIIQVPIMLVLAILLAHAFEQQSTLKHERLLPYMCIPSMCNISGILCIDFPFPVRSGWIYQ